MTVPDKQRVTPPIERRAQAERLMQDAVAKAEAIYNRKIEWHFSHRPATQRTGKP